MSSLSNLITSRGGPGPGQALIHGTGAAADVAGRPDLLSPLCSMALCPCQPQMWVGRQWWPRGWQVAPMCSSSWQQQEWARAYALCCALTDEPQAARHEDVLPGDAHGCGVVLCVWSSWVDGQQGGSRALGVPR